MRATNRKTLQTRVGRLSNIVQPTPTIIDCTGVKEELLATLGAGLDESEKETPIADQALFNELDAMLQASIEQIEQIYNVRFV